MTRRKFVGHEAFVYWVTLGQGRSLASVASEFGVATARVQQEAEKAEWQARLDALEGRTSPAAIDAELAEMDERHLKMIRAIQGRAIEVLAKTPMKTSAEAVRALDVAMNQERSVRARQAEARQPKAHQDPMRLQLDRAMVEEARKAR